MADEYVFIDEWDVDAPQDEVFDALADARTYPEWWRPVYIAVEADSRPQVGCVSRQEFKGRLPYHLKTRSEIVRLERPREFEVSVVGDLTGKGIWTLTPARRQGPHPLRLARDRRPAAAPRAHPRAAAGVPLEPQLVDQARDRGPGALRALSRLSQRLRRRPPPGPAGPHSLSSGTRCVADSAFSTITVFVYNRSGVVLGSRRRSRPPAPRSSSR